MSKKIIIAVTMLCIAFMIFSFTPVGRAVFNQYLFTMQKVDDVTSYETRKKVEDTCRAMIASYEADKLTYESYIENTDPEIQSWAEQRKIRANRTATNYNEYILKNSFVWKDNIPADIKMTLDYIGE